MMANSANKLANKLVINGHKMNVLLLDNVDNQEDLIQKVTAQNFTSANNI